MAHNNATPTRAAATIIITLAQSSLAFLRAASPTAQTSTKAIRVRIENLFEETLIPAFGLGG